MAAFTQSFTATESLDGLTITYYDTSNWGNNDSGYQKANFTRSFIGYDAYGTELFNVILSTTDDSFELSKTTNLWIETTFNIEGAVDFALTQKEGFDRLLVNKFQTATLENCCDGCGSKKSKSTLCEAVTFIKGADYAKPTGNGIKWQENINAADKFLNTIVKNPVVPVEVNGFPYSFPSNF